MSTTMQQQPSLWVNTPKQWVAYGLVALLMAGLFHEALLRLAEVWGDREEYSHGYLIPVISVFLVWQLKNRFAREAFTGSNLGVLLAVCGIVLLLLGELATLWIVVQYAFVITLAGVLWSLVGNRAFPLLIVPLIYLAFMIPLPNFLYNNLSSELQLISSQLGVAVIRLFGISVFLEGNVIDLGIYQLQVVDACSGLRYLFPLTSFAFLLAYLFKAPMWKRVVVFLSSIPITIVMNSIRIGIIGVLVDNFGIEQAEGFLHFFEGWVIFMACVAILLGEIWLLHRIGSDDRPLREVFGIDFPDPRPKDVTGEPRAVPGTFVASGGLMLAALIALSVVSQRPPIIPERESFAQFPLEVDEWSGRFEPMERRFLKALNLTDYFMADYVDGAGESAHFYVAYYEEQRTKGEAAHSPRSCIPGGGWRITSLERETLPASATGGEPLEVNRLQIEKGRNKQLVYYYFKQRQRELTNEYLVKWYLFWDALTMRRTDGALVRYTTIVDPSAPDWVAADERLTRLVRATRGRLEQYVPD